MKLLTKNARNTFFILIIFNALMIVFFSQLTLYNFNSNIKHKVPRKSAQSLVQLTEDLQINPQTKWQEILNKSRSQWLKLTLSEKPTYKKNALLKLSPSVLNDLVKSNKKIEMSIFIKENSWLNVKVISPFPTQEALLFSLALMLILVFLLVNLWIVKTLNQPIQNLKQSLNEDNTQEVWLPIPVTGNSDQKHIIKKINALQNKVSKLLANHTKMVSAISHDLRTPLTRLKLRSEYLVDNTHYEKITNDINEMEFMIKEALDYFQEMNHKEKHQKFDLVAMLNSLYEDTLEVNQNIKFTTNIDKLVYVGAVNLLKRALNNIINNALYYGNKAEIKLNQNKKNIEITITDDGPGISNTDLDSVFTAFYRGESSRSRSTGGAGLGLTIAKEIIEKHKGTIVLINGLEGGLIVKVII